MAVKIKWHNVCCDDVELSKCSVCVARCWRCCLCPRSLAWEMLGSVSNPGVRCLYPFHGPASVYSQFSSKLGHVVSFRFAVINRQNSSVRGQRSSSCMWEHTCTLRIWNKSILSFVSFFTTQNGRIRWLWTSLKIALYTFCPSGHCVRGTPEFPGKVMVWVGVPEKHCVLPLPKQPSHNDTLIVPWLVFVSSEHLGFEVSVRTLAPRLITVWFWTSVFTSGESQLHQL